VRVSRSTQHASPQASTATGNRTSKCPTSDRRPTAVGARSRPLRELCAEKFKDFQFGLKLISQNTGQQEFLLDTDAVQAPDKVLSDWVVASYRSGQAKETPSSSA